ncbi:ATP-binding protein [Nocardioides marmoraquaticus]
MDDTGLDARHPGLVALPSGSFDHYARLAQRLLRAPVALVSLVGGGEQVMPGAAGLTGDTEATRRIPSAYSLCRHVVAGSRPLVVGDARGDARWADEPAVTELGVVAYAGHPLEADDGQVVGSLCAVDTQAREWSADDLEVLGDLAQACSAELRHREQQAAASYDLMRALLDETGALVAVYDARTHELLLANDMARRGAAVVGMEIDRAPWAAAHVRQADNRTPVPPEEQVVSRALAGVEVEPEVHWYGRTGAERAVSIGSRLLRHGDGSPWAVVVNAHDVTDLVRALQVKESFVSSVSHELRTPLAAVIGYAEVLDDELSGLGADASAARHALGVIHRRAADLQHRIADLLDMTDLRRRLELASTDLSALAARVVSGFEVLAADAGHRVEIDAGEPQRAVVDEHRVTQVLDNLLSNAVKHAGPGGRVQVRVDGTASDVVVTVADDGVGMTAGEAEQAFDRFWRGRTAHDAAVPGIGVGLSLVRDIVTAHHGEVTLQSAPGAGTRVIVRLPRSPAAVT